LETRVVRLLERAGFPRPTSQFWIRRTKFKARLDYAYPSQLIYIECDGFGWHQFVSDLDNDARRRNRLVAAGWRPLTLTSAMTDGEIVAAMDDVYDRATGTWKPMVHLGETSSLKCTIASESAGRRPVR
jgi:hypothetical protein